MQYLTRVEISESALTNNIKLLRKINPEAILAACIKGNAYGHDISLVAKTLFPHTDWWAVNSIYEAEKIRATETTNASATSQKPILIIGYISKENLARAIELDCRFVVYNREIIDQLNALNQPAKVHLKVETGLNRQGLDLENLRELISYIQKFPNIEIEGAYSHFANIEDTTDHTYAVQQVEKFQQITQEFPNLFRIRHISNSAASLIFPKFKFNLIRPGIALYGLWPSSETKLSFRQAGHTENLIPALTWKTQVAQTKQVPAGEYVGYGCSYRTTNDSTLAIIPIGYYDGYPRTAKNAHVLINGQRAPIRGRICMNIIIVDVTHIPNVAAETEVTLIGQNGEERITAEDLANWTGTINYEIVTRINESIPRVLVP